MTIVSYPDITGDNAKHAISTTARLRWITVVALGGAARLGDTNVGAARGIQCPQNVPVTLESNGADQADAYSLTQVFAYVPTGTTLTITGGV